MRWIEAAVLSDFVVADSHLLSNLEACMEDRLAVKPTEDNPVLVIAGLNLHPHPLTFAGGIVSEFDFYMITGLISRHRLTHVLLISLYRQFTVDTAVTQMHTSN